MFDWSNGYSVGIDSVDVQHQKLFAIADELYTAMLAGRGKSVLSGILDRLVEYTRSHFAHEERMMILHDYPAFAEHKAEHDALAKKVMQFRAEFQSGRATMSVQLLQFLKDWLATHIKRSDKAFAPYLESKALV